MDNFPLDHVAVAVPSLESAAAVFGRLIGATPTPIEELPAQGVRVCFLGSLELLEPMGPDTTVGRFLQKRGPGLHHVAWRVPELEKALERFRNQGFELIDPVPRQGARGHRVAFLHPRSTGGVLVELVEGR